MSITFSCAATTFLDSDSRARVSRRGSGTAAVPTLWPWVENGCGATSTSIPVSAANSADLPEFARPTIPSLSMGRDRIGIPSAQVNAGNLAGLVRPSRR